MTTARTIADRMAAAADHDLCVPYSLMCDAWDVVADRSNGSTVIATYGSFQIALLRALDGFEADMDGYRLHHAALPELVDSPEPPHVVSGAWPKF